MSSSLSAILAEQSVCLQGLIDPAPWVEGRVMLTVTSSQNRPQR